jgi:hypothetical protein
MSDISELDDEIVPESSENTNSNPESLGSSEGQDNTDSDAEFLDLPVADAPIPS